MEEAVIWMIIALFVCIIGVAAHHLIIPGIFWFIAILSLTIFTILDTVFSASLIPHAPWVMWCIWGIVLGGAFGFWTIAPVYGLRKNRPLILLVPVGLMTIVALIYMVCTW